MSTRAKASGAVGSVIDGRFRDLQEQKDLDYPVRGYRSSTCFAFRSTKSTQVFARDVGTTPPGPLLKVVAVNEPVKACNDGRDILINPGDYLVGDANGVVILPRDLAEQAVPLMGKQVEADSKMAVAIQNGMTFAEASKKFRS